MTDDLDRQLRALMRERADRAPDGDPVAERVLAEVAGAPRVLRPRNGWRTWTMPLLAAAAVAAVVATVLGVSQIRETASPGGPKMSPVYTGGPGPSTSFSPTPRPSTTPSPQTSAPTSAPAVGPSPSGAVVGFRADDLTFVSEDIGWALGSADCLSGSGRCTAIFHTTDGRSWRAVPGEVFNAPGVTGGCASPCVEHIRFADEYIGYAYGPDVLYMTTDGGGHWQRQDGAGGALALETLDGNVIRAVARRSSGCPGPCGVHVETAPLGSSTWTTVQLAPGGIDPIGVQLARSGADAYLLATGHTAGGAANATSTLYASHDDGASWTALGEPCPQSNGEIDSVAVAAAPDSVSALCVPRTGAAAPFLVVSRDGGTGFSRAGAVASADRSLDQLAGDPSTVLVAAGSGAYRSGDGGMSWQRITDVTGTVDFAGFESPSVGRLLTDGGRSVWTTRDGGRTWDRFPFPS